MRIEIEPTCINTFWLIVHHIDVSALQLSHKMNVFYKQIICCEFSIRVELFEGKKIKTLKIRDLCLRNAHFSEVYPSVNCFGSHGKFPQADVPESIVP